MSPGSGYHPPRFGVVHQCTRALGGQAKNFREGVTGSIFAAVGTVLAESDASDAIDGTRCDIDRRGVPRAPGTARLASCLLDRSYRMRLATEPTFACPRTRL